MRYGPQDMTNMMGIGSYVGEVRRGPDGQVYQWVEGVDGLGNPIGFWKAVRAVGKFAARLSFGFGATGALPLRIRSHAATSVGICAVSLSALRAVASLELSAASGS